MTGADAPAGHDGSEPVANRSAIPAGISNIITDALAQAKACEFDVSEESILGITRMSEGPMAVNPPIPGLSALPIRL
jgi:hypothetical protein